MTSLTTHRLSIASAKRSLAWAGLGVGSAITDAVLSVYPMQGAISLPLWMMFASGLVVLRRNGWPAFTTVSFLLGHGAVHAFVFADPIRWLFIGLVPLAGVFLACLITQWVGAKRFLNDQSFPQGAGQAWSVTVGMPAVLVALLAALGAGGLGLEMPALHASGVMISFALGAALGVRYEVVLQGFRLFPSAGRSLRFWFFMVNVSAGAAVLASPGADVAALICAVTLMLMAARTGEPIARVALVSAATTALLLSVWADYYVDRGFDSGLLVSTLLLLVAFAAPWIGALADRDRLAWRKSRMYETVFASSSLGIAVFEKGAKTSADRQRLLKNTAFDRMLGQGDSFVQRECQRLLDEAVEGRGDEPSVVLAVHQREVAQVELSATPVKIAGQVVAVALYARDISAQFDAAAKLAESEARFRSLFDLAPVAIWFHDATTSQALLNPEACRFMGCTESTACAETLYGALSEPDRALYLSWLEGDAPPAPVELCFTSPEGPRWAFVSVQRVRNSDGAVALIGVAIDVQERKDLEVRLVDLTRTLEERVRVRTQEIESFAHSVSHDLRAPVRAIHGYASMLKDSVLNLNPEESRLLEVVLHHAGQMGDTIDGMLNLAGLSVARIRPQAINMSQLVQEVHADLVAQTGIKPQLDLAELPTADLDPKLARVMWVNLLGNAFKFSGQNPRAVIRVGFEDGNYFIEDNGIGFGDAQPDRVFEMFERHNAPANIPGHGIGLSIVRKIVERHGGSIVARNAQSGGARFEIQLPMRVESSASRGV